MSVQLQRERESRDERLADAGYPVAKASRYLKDGKYSDAVRLCRAHLTEEPESLSARLILAMALFKTGQAGPAAEQFHHALSLDPDNVVALKYLGDIKFSEGDEFAAIANYSRVLQIDPDCTGIRSELKKPSRATTKIITLARGGEEKADGSANHLRPIPFYTETMGDLYLRQGYPRLAATVFSRLVEQNDNPRLSDKLAEAELKLRDKDR